MAPAHQRRWDMRFFMVPAEAPCCFQRSTKGLDVFRLQAFRLSFLREAHFMQCPRGLHEDILRAARVP